MLRPYTAAAPLRATLHCITWTGLSGADVDGPERHAQSPPRPGTGVAVRRRRGDQYLPLHLPDDPHHRGDLVGGDRRAQLPCPNHGAYAHLRRGPGPVLRPARRGGGSHWLAVRQRERELVGPALYREPAAGVRPCHAGCDPGFAAATPAPVGGRVVRGVVSGCVPARSDVGDSRGAVWRARVCGDSDLGGDDAQRGTGVHVPLRVLARHDRTARRRRAVVRNTVGAAAGGRVDGVDQESRRRDPAGDGGVLLHSSGDGVVMRYMLIAGFALVVGIGPLRAQDVGLAVGAKAPVVAVEDLDG